MMPDHPALAVEISIATARRLFPGTPNKTFWWVGRVHVAGVRLSFGTAFRAACAHWEAELKAAHPSDIRSPVKRAGRPAVPPPPRPR